ncbi:MAG: PAC2 family protein [Chloroflexi bacterium]|nr:PAC2 family protein [Chloroflexota bacterium]
MKIGDFEINIPDPPLRGAHCIANLKPWINVGNVGQIVLRRLGRMYSAERIGQIERPGKYYDFTRYRPEIQLRNELRSVRVPNTSIRVARRAQGPDLVLLQLLEPHAFAEDYNDSILEILTALKVTRYVQIGGMYDSVPHSRPLPVTGTARGWDPPPDFGGVKLGGSRYQGPTSMTSQISERARNELELETLSLMVHLPLYLKLDDDFAGSARILRILSEIYGFTQELPEIEMGGKQYEQVDPAMTDNPALRDMVERFEREVDSERVDENPGVPLDSSVERISLPPEIEQFLSEIARSDDGEESDSDSGSRSD